MAYGLLLYKEIEAPEGTHRLEVYKDGYAGDAIEIDGLVRDSITIQKNGSAVSDAVVTSVLTFALYDTGQLDYSQFFTPNSTLFKVVYKMGGSPRWTGYLTPDSYTENLASHDVITLTARDNLGRLNDYNFSLAKGQMMSARQIILAGLGVAGVSMDTVFLTTKVATSPETILAVDGLVNTSLLVGMTWHEAVTLLLEGLGLTLAWNDANRIEVRDITQAPSSTQSAFFISKSGYRMIRPAWKNLTAEQDYGLRDNFYEGQFSQDDCGNSPTFTPPASVHWSVGGSFVMMNPYYCKAGAPFESLFIPIEGGDALTNSLTYTFHAPAMDKAIKMNIRCSNSAWRRGVARGGAWATPKISVGSSHGQSVNRYYYLRYRFNVFAVIGGTRYILRESWQEYNPATLEEPYLYFVMPYTETGVDIDNDVTMYLAEIPGAGDIELVIYPAVVQIAEDGEPVDTVGISNYALLKDVTFSVEESISGKSELITISASHNVQSEFHARLGNVQNLNGNVLLYLGGLFYSDNDNTPLASFKRSSADEDTYDLLELVARERISFNNDNYNQLSGTMKAASAFYFNRGIVFDGVTYRIVSASLAVLSNTLSVTAMQNEATFADADYVIEEVDSEGGYSSRGSYSGGSVPQGGGDIVTSEAILALAENDASLAARITSLEDWLLQPAFDDIEAQTINVAGRINLGGMEMEYDAENNAWHLIGSLYADGFITAGGLNTSGGGGGGGLDLGAMWTSLCNQPIATADVDANTKIDVAHLPYGAGAGLQLQGPIFSLLPTGVVAGVYHEVMVDAYGRVTEGANPTTLAGYGITDALGSDELVPLTEGLANIAARVASLEDWLLQPSFDEAEIGVANVSRKVSIGGIDIEMDKNGYLHVLGSLYADGFISAGGLNSSGGGGGVDIGAVWATLTNDPTFTTEDYTASTQIAVAHLPYTAGTGLTLSGAQFALAANGVTAGTYHRVTVDAYGRVTAGDNVGDPSIEIPYSTAIAALSARVQSWEDWFINPSLNEAYIAEFGAINGFFAGTLDVVGNTTMKGTLGVTGLASLAAGLKLTTTKKIWFGDSIYIELDGNGYLHTNGAFYSDQFVSAGGLNSSSGGGGLDLGAMWTSLRNTSTSTSDVTATTKIAVDHIPDITTSKISDLSTWWTTQKNALGLGAAAQKGIGSVADGDTNLVTGDAVYDFTTAAIQTAIGNINTFALKTTTITAGTGLTGGGDLSANRTIALSAASIASLAKADTALQASALDGYVNSLVISGTGDFVTSLSKSGKVLTATMGTIPTTDAIELTLSEAFSGVSARVQSLEDWLLDPTLETAYIADFGASVANLADAYILHRLWFGTHYIELDADGYLHTDTAFYADGFISAGGRDSGGSGGGVDLGAVWTSLCNTPMQTSDVTSTTKIALAHLPYTHGDGISISGAGAISLATSGVAAGTYGSVTVDTYGRVTSGTQAAALSFGTQSYDGTEAKRITATDLGALTSHQRIYTLYVNNSAGSRVISYQPNSSDETLTLTKAMVGLANVENTALSTWGGSAYITTVGTISSGRWRGAAIENAYLANSSITLAGRSVSLGGSLSADSLRSGLSISNVENTALSTWAGSAYLTTLGTITTGVWHGSAIANSYLANSSISIAGRSVSLGGSISANTLLSDLGLGSAASDITTLKGYFTGGKANYAIKDGDGNVIASTYLKLSGGTLTGDLYMGGGNYGRRIFFGNGSYCYIGELSDDVMTLNGDKGINLNTGGNYGVTVSGKFYLTSNAYLEYNASNSGIHASKGIYSDYYITAGSTSSSSDARLKKNCRDVVLAIADIAKAPAVEFDWVDETKGSGAGSIAQYWQDLLPQNVKCWDADGFLSMEYGNIALLASIMLARGYETHEQKIARLERRVAYLEGELQKMRY